eukprot:767539-Hanusia_phi.AAC.1
MHVDSMSQLRFCAHAARISGIEDLVSGIAFSAISDRAYAYAQTELLVSGTAMGSEGSRYGSGRELSA